MYVYEFILCRQTHHTVTLPEFTSVPSQLEIIIIIILEIIFINRGPLRTLLGLATQL